LAGHKKNLAGRMWPAGRYLPTPGLDNVVSWTSHNPIGLQGLLRDSFTFTFIKMHNVIKEILHIIVTLCYSNIFNLTC
jgi:hypothetical protein